MSTLKPTASTLFVFGNGIGLALESGSKVKQGTFKLENAFKKSWGNLNPGTKKIIQNLICQKESPSCENDLRHLQRFCWLSNDEIMKNNITSYLAETTYQFFATNSDVFNATELSQSLCKYIKDPDRGTINIATLNYDKLLYGSFFNKENNLSSYLIDGFWHGKFNTEECENNRNQAGWFLHLHGSPLYRSINGDIIKKSINELENEIKNKTEAETKIEEIEGSLKEHHIILAAPFYKADLIEESYIIKTYWDKLEAILDNTSHIVFIGYSGNDPHLNKIVRQYNLYKISVIEHNFSTNDTISDEDWYDENSRKEFWKSKFNKEITIYPKQDINAVDIQSILRSQQE